MAAVARVGVELDARNAANGLRRLDTAAKKTQGRFEKLRQAVVGLGIAAAALKGSQFVLVKTAQLETQTRSLKVLTGSLEDAQKIIKQLQDFGAVTPFTSDELIETSKRLKAFGFETENLVDVTKRLSDIAGATGADLGGIATAFGQIQAKGRLQGEELLQLQERGVDLQGTLRREYDLTSEQFQKALSKGQIGADAVNFALKKLTDTGGKYAGGAISQSDTLSGKFSTLQDNIQRLAQQLGKVLAPVLKGILNLANETLAGINRVLTSATSRELSLGRGALMIPGGTIGDLENLERSVLSIPTATLGTEEAITSLFAELQALDAQQKAVARTINTTRGATDKEIAAFERLGAAIFKVQKELGQRQLAVREAAQATGEIKIPELGVGTAGAGRGKGGKTPAEILEDQRKASQQRIRDLQDQGALAAALNDEERRQVQLNLDLRDIIENTKGLKAEEVEAEIQARLAFEDKVLAAMEYEETSKRAADAQKKAADEAEKQAQKLQQIYDSIGSSIADGVVGMLDAAVDKTKSLADAAADTLRNVGNILMKLGVNTLLKATGLGIFENLGGFFANGGRPPVGRPSVVGERGPELFVPRTSGTIIPNHALGAGANVTVNVDASGSSVEGNGGEAAQLGKVLGLAVQQELLKQKRPGGLLAT